MKAQDLTQVRRTLWAAADEMRANSSLTPPEYRGPVLGLIFLAYAEQRFDETAPELKGKQSKRRPITSDDYRRRGVLYVPDEAKLSDLVALPESQNLGKAIDDAMKAIEAANPELRDVLPRGYQRIAKSTLSELLRLFAPLPRQLSGDAFGLIYEDFLSNFAEARAACGGEFFTPYSIVRLIVEIIEPFHGRVYDPACGSGGMFVQCAKFVERHHGSADPRAVGLRPGAEGGHRSAGEDEPRPAWPLRRHPPGQQLLRGPPRRGRRVRLRHGQPAVQRRQGRQGQARRRSTVPIRPSEARQRQLSLDPAVLRRAQRQRAGRICHGQLRRRRWPLRTESAAMSAST